MTANYFQEAYTESKRSQPSKKIGKLFAIVLSIAGAILLIQSTLRSTTKILVPLVFITAGLCGIVIDWYNKTRWIKDRMKSNVLNKEVLLTFTDKGIVSKGPFSTGELIWEGIQSALQTKKGILLKPETGIMIYIPGTSFAENNQIAAIINKVKGVSKDK